MSTQQQLVRAYIETGLRAHASGDLGGASQAFQQALGVAPDNPDALNLLGAVLVQLGRPADALDFLKRAARQRRNDPGVLGNFAQACFAAGKYEEALETFRKARRFDPGAMSLQLGIANSLAMKGRLDEAESILRKLAERFPDDALVLFNFGNVLRDLKRYPESVDCYVKALQIEPRFADARNNLGGSLQALFRFGEAEREYRACIESCPNSSLARCNLASVLIDLGRFEEAEQILRVLIALTPEMSRAHAFLAAALWHQGRLREALRYQHTAAEIDPDNLEIAEIYAMLLIQTGKTVEGLRRFWRARGSCLIPDSVHRRLDGPLLAIGCLIEGWIEYSYRPAFVSFREKYPDIELSRTLPAELQGKNIFLLPEQGLGDEIFFLRFAPQLADAGARLIYHASTKICSLLKRLPCLRRVEDESVPVPNADIIMMLGDLPQALSNFPRSSLPATTHANNVDMREFPHKISVFWPPIPPSLVFPPLENSLVAMRRRLGEAGPPPYAGVTWRGGTPPEEQHGGAAWLLYKQVGIEPLAETMRKFPGTLLALQRNPRAGEIETFSRLLDRTVHDFSDLNEHLEDMLALLALIDEYIGVSNTNMHLRAAAGRTARVLIPCPAEWRWMASDASSPWFPGFSLYRQTIDGDWRPALAALAKDLAK